jgi:mono/diheme cytochrome c family protein
MSWIKNIFFSQLLCFMTAISAQTSIADSLLTSLACGNCHLGVRQNPDIRKMAPDLSHAGLRYRPAYIYTFLQSPKRIRYNVGAARMPGFHFDEREALAVTLYLMEQKKSVNLAVLPKGSVSNVKLEAERLIEGELECTRCHGLNGKGQNSSTDLTDAGMRLNRDWLKQYLIAPRLFDGNDTAMPSYFYQVNATTGDYKPVTPDASVRIDAVVDYFMALTSDEAKDGEKQFSAIRRQYPEVTAETGRTIVQSQNCQACHTLDGLEPWFERNGPDLSIESQRVRRGWLIGYLSESHAVRPFGYFPGSGSRMPDYRLTDDEVEVLTEHFVKKGSRGSSGTPDNLSAFSQQKAESLLQEKLSCLGCHRLGNLGGKIGPDLTNAASRLKAPFVDMMILNPRMLVPESIMPKVPLPSETARLMGNYLKGAVSQSENLSYLSLIDHEPYNPKGSVYREFCSVCHGLTGSGDGFNARYLPKTPISHSDPVLMSERPNDTLYDGIHAGGAVLNRHHFMPPWGETLSPHDMQSLVEKIRKFCQCQGPDWSESQ